MPHDLKVASSFKMFASLFFIYLCNFYSHPSQATDYYGKKIGAQKKQMETNTNGSNVFLRHHSDLLR